jgi:ABC-type transporter Mla subunit MlaD
MFLGALALLVLIIVWLTQWGQTRNMYPVIVHFPQAQGLYAGNQVRVAGVVMGQVAGVTLEDGTNQPLVECRVNKGVRLFQHYQYQIQMGGLVGDRFIEITPVTEDPGALVQPGDRVEGVLQADLNSIMVTAGKLVDSLNQTATSVNNVIGDPKVQQDMKGTLADLRRTMASAATLTAKLDAFAAHNFSALDVVMANLSDVSNDVRRVSDTLTPQLTQTDMLRNAEIAAKNVATMTARLNQAAGDVEKLVGDPELAAGLRDTAKSLQASGMELEGILADAHKATGNLPAITASMSQATADLPTITGNMRTASNDMPGIMASMNKAAADMAATVAPFKGIAPATAENLRLVAANLQETSERLNRIAIRLPGAGGGAESTVTAPEVRVVGFTDDVGQRFRADANLDLRSGDREVRVGLADVGHSNGLNLQLGERLGTDKWFRYGLVESYAGVGLDALLGSRWHGTVEVFDVEKPKANLIVDRTFSPFGPGWSLSAGVYGLGQDGRLGVGATYRP